MKRHLISLVKWPTKYRLSRPSANLIVKCDDSCAHVALGICGELSFLARVVLRFLGCADVGDDLGMRSRSGISVI